MQGSPHPHADTMSGGGRPAQSGAGRTLPQSDGENSNMMLLLDAANELERSAGNEPSTAGTHGMWGWRCYCLWVMEAIGSFCRPVHVCALIDSGT